ncbi:cytochrome d ubiquinol oxidase subunit II [Actinophytocola xinjiangensis]|uniref:Cytochrome d ubiquinol oxidase subunit II n=1 Tax=Actinophytocola xinjiangensis TaxID=485602 RepID=A0A7Z1AWE9_9PSEU|nr:cytochrome d ubiquinol oxidase subunit II [Actinophytocola xinjiangensis]OLF06382.1 cytochrome d ubiquinol oxidase subunit II [Actinophytocola xinjiangensis]
MDLATLWFVLIAVLWLGYLFLEGFDFGVGMLLRVLGRDERTRRVLVNTIGPVWDGNEVWLIVAAGATFAAFPGWYAGLFSAAYLPLLLVLLALIGRGVAFEYRGKIDSARWRALWDTVITGGSAVAALGVGLLLSWNVLGLPLDARGDRVGSAFAALRWETLVGALGVAGFALLHGAVFLALKTEGEVRERARRLALRVAPVALAPLAATLAVVQVREGSGWTLVPLGLAALAAVLGWLRLAAGREGQAFAALGVVIAGTVATWFGALYPNVLPSTVDPAFSLTIADTASSPYTLTVMTWVAAFGTPAVLVYQGWTYWVFRRRIGTRHIPEVHAP